MSIAITSVSGQPGQAIAHEAITQLGLNQVHSGSDAIIESNRQTEKDIKSSILKYCIGRNGLYLEADLEALKNKFRNTFHDTSIASH